MATQNRQSQLYRCLSLLLLVALSLAARADDIDPSGYRPSPGRAFFLLTESNFDSSGEASVRLEFSDLMDAQWLESTYSGVDVVLYRVPDPVAFLRAQKNLHRIQVAGDYQGEGIANALRYTWDSLYKRSRLSWQRVFSEKARAKVVEAAPRLRQTPPHSYQTRFDNDPQFKPLAGFELVTRFRYPVWQAKPIQPPKEVELAGSSSEFIEPQAGHVRVPLGRLAPGLYLVEAYIGSYRATALAFVSDTVAVTKVSGDQMLVWTARRASGEPVAGSRVLLTDGVGTLESGTTGADGALLIKRKSPERSYVIGTDPAGGVFISENFYYDSEIHAAKLYAFTDRPLYQPGDKVCTKLFGRMFRSARESVPLAAGEVRLAVLDPYGTPITTQGFAVRPEAGGDTCFQLPDQAASGGYTLRLDYQGQGYTASFRVAEYVKPHYEVEIAFDRKGFKTGEPVTGRVRLTYPGGKPVAGASVELSLRAQPLTLVEGELRYQGLFPVKVVHEALESDAEGSVAFELPPAQLPSRYVLRVVTMGGAAYRVSASSELIVEAGSPAYGLKADQRLSRMNEEARFTLLPLGSFSGRPARWEAIRLEDQSRSEGLLDGAAAPDGSERFAVRFARSGSYTLNVLDASGRIVATLDHWVAGPDLRSAPGSIAVVLDKDAYRPGETAHALITFPEEVHEALLTLERDRVEHHSLLSTGSDTLRVERRSPTQWAAAIPVTAEFSPNITLSVLYVLNGQYLFQNKGIKVAVPRVQTVFTPDKPEYRPGEKVTVAVETTVEGKPVSAHLAVGVVDEAVYVLQPEIAPDIGEFFHHLRRDQVRTSSSLSFHTYDLAIPAKGSEASAGYSQRVIKVPERPRRENIDTAAWFPDLVTDAQGRASFSFTLPDSIARWRITGRAATESGQVGQNSAWLRAHQDYYLKWTGPTAFRQGDQARVAMTAFNAGSAAVKALFTAEGPNLKVRQELTLRPGSNDVELPLTAGKGGFVDSRLAVDGQPADALQKWVTVVPDGWLESRTEPVNLVTGLNEIPAPEGGRNFRLGLAGSAGDSFLRVADDLLEYPWGCVEQTASRLIPLGLAFGHLGRRALPEATAARLHQQLGNQRLRLARMAGPGSAFGWWGDVSEESAFLTAYAYYADRLALDALDVKAPPEHWQKLLEVYRRKAEQEPLLQQALILWMAAELDLPVRTLREGVIARLPRPATPAGKPAPLPVAASRIMTEEAGSPAGLDMAVVVLGLLEKPAGQGSDFANRLAQARGRLAGSDEPMAQALLLLDAARQGTAEPARADAILARLRPELPTIERALTLAFVQKALGGFRAAPAADSFDPGSDWKRREARLGAAVWSLQVKTGDHLRINAAAPVTALLSYDTWGVGRSVLPVTIERRLYRLKPPEKEEGGEADGAVESGGDEEAGPQYEAVPLAATADLTVSTSELYLDEVIVTPGREATAYRHGVVDVALPPGAEVESTTWGMTVTGLEGESEPLEMPETVHQPGKRAYSLPVTHLEEPRVYRHLLRFSQRGSFTLPPARYFRMYRPTEQAYEAQGAGRRVVVE